jgi:hypothetical protein
MTGKVSQLVALLESSICRCLSLSVSRAWGFPFMLTNFGWKAVLGILVANAIYYLRFRRELAVLAGAVAGGGLTVIANAPNPAGQSILVSRFGDEGISAVKLFLWAILPTVIMRAAFMLLR